MSDLAKRLASLSSMNLDGLDNPMCQDDESPSSPNTATPTSNYSFLTGVEESRRGRKKRDVLGDLEERAKQMRALSADAMADSLDEYLDDMSEDDIELRESLIGLGRKYHRDTATVSGQTSEITKRFNESSQKLRALYSEIADDRAAIQKDIDQMRLARTRNHKALADLISAKGSYYSTQLQIRKELNAMTKAEYDLLDKERQRNKEEAGAASVDTSSAIRNLFSIGRKDMVASMGGYENISGATENSTVSVASDDDDHGLVDLGEEDDDEDGEVFLRYEGMGVEYILLVDSDKKVQGIIAEDKNGDIVPDYPIPEYSNLSFNINSGLGTATDDYHRSYRVREV